MQIAKCKTKSAAVLAGVAGCLLTLAGTSSAGLARLGGGSGYSGNLDSNQMLREQQLICDPAAPIAGSTSVHYDPKVVSLSGLLLGPGYTGHGVVEEEKVCHKKTVTFLQNINSFLKDPLGTQTGYVQVSYTLSGTAGTMPALPGFVPKDIAGVAGVDTHSLLFKYLASVPDSAIADYCIYADTGKRRSGNRRDFLKGIGPNGKTFVLGPSQLSSAEVSGNLVSVVPLPPTAWAGLAMLLALFSATIVRGPGQRAAAIVTSYCPAASSARAARPAS